MSQRHRGQWKNLKRVSSRHNPQIGIAPAAARLILAPLYLLQSGGFVVRTDFLPYIFRTLVFGHFLPVTSRTAVGLVNINNEQEE